MLMDRGEGGASVVQEVGVGNGETVDETVLAEDVLGDSSSCFSDGAAIALFARVIDASLHETGSDAASSESFLHSKHEQVNALAG